jgi:hypothetical protein
MSTSSITSTCETSSNTKEVVDRQGIEPCTRGLQSDAAHQRSAHGASDRTRTGSLRRTKAAHVRTCSTGLVPSEGFEPATDGRLTTVPLPLGYEGVDFQGI